MRVLVTGGAGYIGSHTVVRLVEAGHEVRVVDDLSNSSPIVLDRIEEITGVRVPLDVVDVTDRGAVTAILAQHPVDAAIHLAGLKAVGESVEQPLRYYRTNLDATFSLVGAMADAGVRTLVFSSSATVYGAQASPPFEEDLPTSATNPYGWTKVMQEQVLRDVAAGDPRWRIALLRYFNPVGAHPSGRIGEDPQGHPNNLVPYLAQVAVGRREKLLVFGDDYDTPDGTGLRDYIHVEDLAAGHLAALETLAAADAGGVRTWNLGTGSGTSVLEVLAAFSRAVGRELPYEVVGRRAGDIAASWADPTRAHRELGWRAEKGTDEMCADTWRWQETNPAGYDGPPA